MLTAPHLGERIRDLRKEQGLSQDELARRAGTSQVQVSRIETGEHEPRFATLRKFAEALGVDMRELV